jgi:2-polyprenyl-6-methoxyphenol hydroxylase-like FAD-dependent oxidoreductase
MTNDEPMPAALSCRCCIVGGGPAGMMLGLLLARAGVDTIVLEKHADFLRDFRGDTIHPSTLEAMNDLGLLDEFLKLPHQEVPSLAAQIGDVTIPLVDFTHLPTRAKFIAMMPQWDFLDFLAEKAKSFSGFRLLMSTEATGLIIEDGAVAGVRARTKDGGLVIRAGLTIGADGRHSLVREAAGFAPQNIGAPMDVFWFRLSREAGDCPDTFGRIDAGQILILINRGEHWQCAYVIAKGAAEKVKAMGVEFLRQRLSTLAPFLSTRSAELQSFDDVKLLTVAIDRLPVWCRAGLLCIGDSAHAMSPIGGVGVNLAIQDAIAAANLLSKPLLGEGTLSNETLELVQARRERPARITQSVQVFIQNHFISRVLGASGTVQPPWFLRLFIYFPVLRRLPGRMIGLGVQPERVDSPDASASASSR